MSSRDPTIQRIFEVADDSLQGILGHYLYVGALQSALASNIEKITEKLPERQFPMTFSWFRYYEREDLVQAFSPPVLQIYQARISLTSIVTVFDVMLNDFVKHLREKGFSQNLKDKKLKNCLKWAYEQLQPCEIGDTETIKRLPITFGIIDNARRLRNLIIHNQGLFEERYELDVLKFSDIEVDMHPHYQFYMANPQKPIPVILDTEYFLNFSKAHLEVLHLLHNQIQKKCFGYSSGYDYRVENKPIEWNKALWGNAKVILQPIEPENKAPALNS